jgi:hypothetical protein
MEIAQKVNNDDIDAEPKKIKPDQIINFRFCSELRVIKSVWEVVSRVSSDDRLADYLLILYNLTIYLYNYISI